MCGGAKMGMKKISHNTVLAAIARRLETQSYSPSIEELRQDLGYASRASVWTRLRFLEAEGLIERAAGGKARSIRLVGDKSETQFKLCLVKDSWAWFTTCPLEEQWGGDWDDAPYYLNAGPPAGWGPSNDQRYELRMVAFLSDSLFSPQYLPTPRVQGDYSVQQINRGSCPWLFELYGDRIGGVIIPAGTPLPQFRRLIWQAGGRVFEEIPPPNSNSFQSDDP